MGADVDMQSNNNTDTAKKGSAQALANPAKSITKSKQHLPTKKISEKANSVFSVKSVFKFLSTPKAYGHYIVTDIIFRVAVVSLAFGRATNQKMKHG